MVRVGSLHDQMLLEDNPRENKTNMTAEEQIDAIADRVKVLSARHDLAYRELMAEL
jgi:polyphosphate kinase